VNKVVSFLFLRGIPFAVRTGGEERKLMLLMLLMLYSKACVEGICGEVIGVDITSKKAHV